ncbi:hypothetical protein [Tannerella forsythia]|uniref:Uncharacterized protein n=1 Tax=Tannerella forsythia TaxID=28112 RepID=A0A3P1YE25_TANFO|nr:hypothetical protein [Tannerella forsythia]RRD69101.1 hypothetical protein EII41_13665 [Tannerella forsythia]
MGYPHDSTQTQNIFGAGESARLEAGQVVFPGGGTWTNAEIQIFGHGNPGNITGAGNIVIHSYNAGGRYDDYTNVWTGSWSGNGNGRCPVDPWPAWDGGGINWNGPNPVPNYNSNPCNAAHIHGPVSGGTSDPYTSNQLGGADDGVSLVQTAGTVVKNDGTWASRGTPKTSGGGLNDYKRPTTIAISGKTTINQIAVLLNIYSYFIV